MKIAFTSDPAKAKRNAREKGITFKTGEEVFDDAFVVIYEDCEDANGELRYHALGRAWSQVLLVTVFVDRSIEQDQLTYHIISVRKAEDYEIQIYAERL